MRRVGVPLRSPTPNPASRRVFFGISSLKYVQFITL
jgi:hypothetical protein